MDTMSWMYHGNVFLSIYRGSCVYSFYPSVLFRIPRFTRFFHEQMSTFIVNGAFIHYTVNVFSILPWNIYCALRFYLIKLLIIRVVWWWWWGEGGQSALTSSDQQVQYAGAVKSPWRVFSKFSICCISILQYAGCNLGLSSPRCRIRSVCCWCTCRKASTLIQFL